MTDPEHHVDARGLADIMGLSVPTVRRMDKAGMPSETWGRRARRYLPSRCIAWAQEQNAE